MIFEVWNSIQIRGRRWSLDAGPACPLKTAQWYDMYSMCGLSAPRGGWNIPCLPTINTLSHKFEHVFHTHFDDALHPLRCTGVLVFEDTITSWGGPSPGDRTCCKYRMDINAANGGRSLVCLVWLALWWGAIQRARNNAPWKLESQIFVAHPWGALLGDGKVSIRGVGR